MTLTSKNPMPLQYRDISSALIKAGSAEQAVLSAENYEHRAQERYCASLGEAALKALDDPQIIEIMLNDDGALFAEFLGGAICRIGEISAHNAMTFVRMAASIHDAELKKFKPIFSAELKDSGARIEALLPPLVKNPVFSIRKHNALSMPLDELVRGEMLNKDEADFLRQALSQKRTIVVSGATGSGKTTLVNALLNELGRLKPQERILTLEDTPELKILNTDKLSLYTTEEADLGVLLRSALRLRPDRIVVGEVRGAEALDLVDAFSTGHAGGLCTVHAGSLEQALMRLTLLISRHSQAPRFIEPTLAEAMDVMVQLERTNKRKVSAIGEVLAYADGKFEIYYHNFSTANSNNKEALPHEKT